MGLDQYAHTRQPADSEFKTELFYWRKHADLQGWMEALWYSKGGEEVFNMVELDLTSEDLDQLAKDMATGLKTTQGFFFGQSYPEDTEATLEFITKAREELAKGRKVSYWSWW